MPKVASCQAGRAASLFPAAEAREGTELAFFDCDVSVLNIVFLFVQPERINPDPTHPNYDIRADVWSLGISLVELASGVFPYSGCKTDFEMLTKILEDDPPSLPPNLNFSIDFRRFVASW